MAVTRQGVQADLRTEIIGMRKIILQGNDTCIFDLSESINIFVRKYSYGETN